MQNVSIAVIFGIGSSFILIKVDEQHSYISSPPQTLLGQTPAHLGSVTLHWLGTFFQILAFPAVLTQKHQSELVIR